MDELTSEQKTYLRQGIFSRELYNKEIKQFSLKKTPKTLRGFCDLLVVAGTDHEIDDKRLIWINSDSCFGSTYLSGWLDSDNDSFQVCFELSIKLSNASRNSRSDTLEVFSETELGALWVLEILFSATDDYYTEMEIRNYAAKFPGELKCPFDRQLDAIFCQNPSRQKFDFAYLNFRSQDFGGVLPTSGKALNLRFAECSFDDSGASFAQDFAARLDEMEGPARLEFKNSVPEFLVYNLNNRYKNVHLKFQEIEFNIRQCRALASAEIRKLEFYDCTFDEADDGDGASFAQDFAASLTKEGSASLEFKNSVPKYLVYNLDYRHKNLHLKLQDIEFNIRQCQALASAEIRKLELYDCIFDEADGGQSLVDSVRAGRGPRGLSLGTTYEVVFDTDVRFLSFITALQGNEHLESLELRNNICEDLDCAKALAEALRQNTKLTHLGCCFNDFDDKDSWIALFDAITTHPTLRTLELSKLNRRELPDDLTPALIEMTRTNRILEEIEYHNSDMIDPEVFRLRVAPQLEYNRFRKQVLNIRDVYLQSTRAGIAAKALVRLKHNPSLVYMILGQNMDSLVLAGDDVDDISQNSSRKRKHL